MAKRWDFTAVEKLNARANINRGWTQMDADTKRSRLQAQGRRAALFALHLQSGGLAAANHLRASASICGQATLLSGLYMCPLWTFG